MLQIRRYHPRVGQIVWVCDACRDKGGFITCSGRGSLDTEDGMGEGAGEGDAEGTGDDVSPSDPSTPLATPPPSIPRRREGEGGGEAEGEAEGDARITAVANVSAEGAGEGAGDDVFPFDPSTPLSIPAPSIPQRLSVLVSEGIDVLKRGSRGRFGRYPWTPGTLQADPHCLRWRTLGARADARDAISFDDIRDVRLQRKTLTLQLRLDITLVFKTSNPSMALLLRDAINECR